MPPKTADAEKRQAEIYKPDEAPFAYYYTFDTTSDKVVMKRFVSQVIPDNILSTGNLATLEDFYEKNKERMTKADLQYMNARLHTARKIENLEKKAKADLYNDVQVPKLKFSTSGGFSGLAMKLPRKQTSDNGCWSCSLELLLKSRGVELTQEEIRAFRPDFKAGEEQQMSDDRRKSMDLDRSAYLYDQSDLILKVLPNTAVQQLTLNPLQYDFGFEGKEKLKGDDFVAARAQGVRAYKKVFKEQFAEIVRNALDNDRSPISLNLGNGHFVTITGISKKGDLIRVEDSLRSKTNTTDFLRVDELIDKYMVPKSFADTKNGCSLVWLKDITPPEYEPGKKKDFTFDPIDGRTAETDEKGKLTFRKNDTQDSSFSVSTNPKPGNGMLKGQELTRSVVMDEKKIKKAFNGRWMSAFGGDKQFYLGSVQTYYPKEVFARKDPRLKGIAPTEEELRKENEILGAAPAPVNASKAKGKKENLNSRKDNKPEEQKQGRKPEQKKEDGKQGQKPAGDNNTAKKSDQKNAQKNIDQKEQNQQKPQDAEENISRLLQFDEDQKNKDPKRPPAGTFNCLLYDMQQKIFLGDLDEAYYLSVICATLQRMDEKKDPKIYDNNPKMESEDIGKVGEYTEKNLKIISDQLEKEETRREELKRMAVEKKPVALLSDIEKIENRYKESAKGSREDRKEVFDQAFQLLGDVSNTNQATQELENAIQGFKEKYESGKDTTGRENYECAMDLLDYVERRKQPRVTESLRNRFDAAMRCLYMLLPDEEFKDLCDRINQARKVEDKQEDPSHVKPEDYAPKKRLQLTQPKPAAQKNTQAQMKPSGTRRKF